MIDRNVEMLTAQEAAEAGLLDSIKRGEAKVEGHYSITPEGKLKFKQTTFTFTDSAGNWSFGRFADEDELLKFGGKNI
ncbi:MAG: hypothetical protein IJU91_08720 [Selenomonadaceae bacterium]|nr:hypothetical protein [Selenomonadaceae bacterium]